MSMVTHSRDANSQQHMTYQQLNSSSEYPWWLAVWISSLISNWIWALNVQGDSLPGCKFTRACQQLNLSSECPGWLTYWMQVHRGKSAIEFELWMSMVTHSLDAILWEHVSNWIWALHICDDSLSGCKFTGAYQQLNLSTECPGWLTFWMQVHRSRVSNWI